jgi:tetratricopeptide (TPR) repeat protein
LKPSNILVAPHDGVPVVKVIDFGVAKAMGQRLTEKTVYTRFTQMIGTPLYMSPEQAEINALDVDTRSDIYSLGVVLYELLTGTTPFDRQRFAEAAQDEIRRIIREEEPPRPSTRLSSMRETLPTVSARRRTQPDQLSALIKGDLDWIVMKALEKDRNLRYETVSVFAADVQSYLQDEPVRACPPSVRYRFRKFARRNRRALRGLCAAGLVMLLAAGAAGWMVRDRQIRQEANTQRVDGALAESDDWMKQKRWPEAHAAARRAEGLLAAAEGAANRQDRVDRLLADLAMLGRLEEIRLAAAAVNEIGFDSSQTSALYLNAFREFGLDVEMQSPPEGAKRLAVSGIPVELAAALDDWALDRKAAGPKATPAWTGLLALARAIDLSPWRQALRSALEKSDRQSLLVLASSKATHEQPALTLVNLAQALRLNGMQSEAVTLLRKAQERHPGDFWINHDLGIGLKGSTPPQPEEALRFLTVAAALRPRSPGVQVNLCSALRAGGRIDESVAAARKAIALDADFVLGYSNLGIVLALQASRDLALASLLEASWSRPDFTLAATQPASRRRYQQQVQEAIAAHREAVRRAPGDAGAHYNLGLSLEKGNQLAAAAAAYREAIRLRPDLAWAHNNLGFVLGKLGQWDACLASHREAVRVKPDYAKGYFNLGTALAHRKQWPEAIAAFREAVRLQSDYPRAYENLAFALRATNRLEAAIDAFREALRQDPSNAALQVNLGSLLMRQGQGVAAVAAGRAAISLEPGLAVAHYNLGNALAAQGESAGAVVAYQEAIRLRPNYAEAYCNLGQALKSRGELQPALANLRTGHQLGSRQSGWRYASEEWLRKCERLVELEPKLAQALSGELEPTGGLELLEFAELCSLKHLDAASVDFYERAFAKEPALEHGSSSRNLFRAACAAAQAGCAANETSPSLPARTPAYFRKKALIWLNQELDALSAQEEGSVPAARDTLRRALDRWKTESALALLREPEARARLSKLEQEQWQKLWEKIDRLEREFRTTDRRS